MHCCLFVWRVHIINDSYMQVSSVKDTQTCNPKPFSFETTTDLLNPFDRIRFFAAICAGSCSVRAPWSFVRFSTVTWRLLVRPCWTTTPACWTRRSHLAFLAPPVWPVGPWRRWTRPPPRGTALYRSWIPRTGPSDRPPCRPTRVPWLWPCPCRRRKRRPTRARCRPSYERYGKSVFQHVLQR